MDTRLDPLAEPLRCAHGTGEFVVLGDTIEWLTPCRECVTGTVAEPVGAVAAA